MVVVLGLVTTPNVTEGHPSGTSGNPAVIHACVQRGSGLTRIVGDTEACSASETPLHWNAGRFIDLGLTIFDTKTQLEWEKKTTAVGSGRNPADLHDVDNYYFFSEATGSWIASVNAAGFGGHADWRVPSLEEARTLLQSPCSGEVAFGRCIDPVFDPVIFSSHRADSYWTTTPADPGFVYAINFSGIMYDNGSTTEELLHVLAVRGGP
jgi:hypothetical protein